MFCSCDNSDTDKPNKHICEVCTGQPGTLPKVNQQAIDYGIMMSLALNCDVQNFNKFDRKTTFIQIYLKVIKFHSLMSHWHFMVI